MINSQIGTTSSLVLCVILTLCIWISIYQVSINNAEADVGITDFNGDGYADLAIMVREDIGTAEDAGAVNVLYGSSSGLGSGPAADGTGRADQIWNQNTKNVEDSSEGFDYFGWSLSTGDFNNDGYSDLAVGVPREDLGDILSGGVVNVIYGSSQGLSATALGDGTGRSDQLWSQNSANVDGTAETGDAFGSALASDDFNHDGYDDLAIGVPGEDNEGGVGEGKGAVNVIYGSKSGLSATVVADQVWSQDSSNIEDTAEFLDTFGSSLAAGDINNDGYDDLAIGVPQEGLGDVHYVGAVSVIYGSNTGLSATKVLPDQFWSQGSADIANSPEFGDAFGSSLAFGYFNDDKYADLAIGVPSESVVSVTSAGAVNVIYGSASGLSATFVPDQSWTQNSPNIEDTAESEDLLGTSLTTGDFNGDGRDDLAIGAPWETLGATSAAGAVNVIYGSPSGLQASLPNDQFWHQNSLGVEGTAQNFDFFGEQITSS